MRMRRVMNVDDERGATLVLVALAMFGLLGVAALAVDAAAAFAWRTEAQKIADASALAGGSAFMDFTRTAAVQPAQDRAYDYALQHTIKGEAVDSSEVTVVVIPDSLKVRVGINRTGLPTWFARIFGLTSVDIGAIAAAQAEAADAARCMKPIAVPDAWYDEDDDTDGDNVWDTGEAWDFDSGAGDRYQRFGGPNDPSATTATGYGSMLRGSDRDWGRQMQLKAQNPQSEFNPEPGIFLPWRLPLDDSQEVCSTGGGGGGAAGAATYRQNLCTCNNSQIELFTPYDLQPGNMVGPTSQGIGELIDQDPTAYWNPNANGGKGAVVRPDGSGGHTVVGTASPRVVKMALFDPTQINTSGMQSIVFNNFALFFIEAQANGQAPVQGRFMYFVGGEDTGDGEGDGTLVRYLRLVE